MNNITQLLQNIPKFNHANHSTFNFRIVNSILKYLKVEAFRALLTIIAGIAKLGHLTWFLWTFLWLCFIFKKLNTCSIVFIGWPFGNRGSSSFVSHAIETFLMFSPWQRLRKCRKGLRWEVFQRSERCCFLEEQRFRHLRRNIFWGSEIYFPIRRNL